MFVLSHIRRSPTRGYLKNENAGHAHLSTEQRKRVADVLVGLEVVIGRAAHEVLSVRVIMAGNEEATAGAARKTNRLTYHYTFSSFIGIRTVWLPLPSYDGN